MTENTTDQQMDHMKGVIESLLFVNERPVTLDQIKSALETVSAPEIKQALQELIQTYKDLNGGILIKEIAGGYQMLSNPQHASYIRKFYKKKHKEKLSKPSLETLAIIAYKQPVTRADVEIVRGVNSDGVVVHLIDKELIKVVGRKDVPGRPYLYGTTKQFLEYFGLKSLEKLPKLEEFIDYQAGEEPENEEKMSEEQAPSNQLSQGASKEDSEEGKVSDNLNNDSSEDNQNQRADNGSAQTSIATAEVQQTEKKENAEDQPNTTT